MARFIDWFNASRQSMPILERAAVSHVYFESIHPFEDGRGRIGRLLIEKVLSHGVERPVLITVSKVFEKRKRYYYKALELCNRTLKIMPWIEFFADAILQAQSSSNDLLHFILEKPKMMRTLSEQINHRQEKALGECLRRDPSVFRGA